MNTEQRGYITNPIERAGDPATTTGRPAESKSWDYGNVAGTVAGDLGPLFQAPPRMAPTPAVGRRAESGPDDGKWARIGVIIAAGLLGLAGGLLAPRDGEPGPEVVTPVASPQGSPVRDNPASGMVLLDLANGSLTSGREPQPTAAKSTDQDAAVR